MLLPSQLIGPAPDIRALRKTLRKLKEGKGLHDVLPATANHHDIPGRIVLNGPFSGGGFDPSAFFPSAPLYAWQTPYLPEEHFTNFALESFRQPWSLLGCLSQYGYFIVARTHLHLPFLRACRASWAEFDEIGPSYSLGLDPPTTLWQEPQTLKILLAQLGVRPELLDAAETAAHVSALIDRGLALVDMPS